MPAQQSGKTVLKHNPVISGLGHEDEAINTELLQSASCTSAQGMVDGEMAHACAIAGMEEDDDIDDSLEQLMETDMLVDKTPSSVSSPIINPPQQQQMPSPSVVARQQPQQQPQQEQHVEIPDEFAVAGDDNDEVGAGSGLVDVLMFVLLSRMAYILYAIVCRNLDHASSSS